MLRQAHLKKQNVIRPHEITHHSITNHKTQQAGLQQHQNNLWMVPW